MKDDRKRQSLFIIILLFIVSILFGNYLDVDAKTYTKGWHLVPATGEWKDTEKTHWAYYDENGKETKRYRVLACAHRGWSTTYPEESMAGFMKAYQEGYPEVEGDIRYDKDGVPVLLHDPAVNRVAIGQDCVGEECFSTCTTGSLAGKRSCIKNNSQTDTGEYSPQRCSMTQDPNINNNIHHVSEYVSGSNECNGNCKYTQCHADGGGNGKVCASKNVRTNSKYIYIKDHSVSWINMAFKFNLPTYNNPKILSNGRIDSIDVTSHIDSNGDGDKRNDDNDDLNTALSGWWIKSLNGYDTNEVTTFDEFVKFLMDYGMHAAVDMKQECDTSVDGEVTKQKVKNVWNIIKKYNAYEQVTWKCGCAHYDACLYLKQILDEETEDTHNVENISMMGFRDDGTCDDNSGLTANAVYNQLKSSKTRVAIAHCPEGSECQRVYDEVKGKRISGNVPLYLYEEWLDVVRAVEAEKVEPGHGNGGYTWWYLPYGKDCGWSDDPNNPYEYYGNQTHCNNPSYVKDSYLRRVRQTITPTVSGVESSYEYTGESIKPEITVKKGGTELVEGEDYTVSYGENKEAGTNKGTVTIKSVDSSPYLFETITKKFNIIKTVDLVLFWGQSNMVGSIGEKTCNGELQKDHVDENKTSLGVEEFGKQTNIYTSIVNRYDTLGHESVPFNGVEIYDYSFTNDELIPITSNTETVGENLYCDNGHVSSSGSVQCSRKSEGANMIPWFGHGYNTRTGRKVVAVHVAVPGVSSNHFRPDAVELGIDNRYLYQAMIEKYRAAETYLNNNNYTIKNKYDIVFQGESNAGSACENNNNVHYTWDDDYLKIHRKLQSDIGIEFGAVIYTARASGETCQDGTKSMYDGVELIHTAQKKVVEENDDVILGTSFPYDHYVPDADNYKGTYPYGLPGSVEQKTMDYNTALERSRLLTAAQCGGPSDSLHYNAAALSQIGSETAYRIVRYLQRETIVPEVNGYNVSYEYTGSAIKPEVTVKVTGTDTVLEKGIDYKVTYGENTNVGEGSITITSIEGSIYTFSPVTIHFQIVDDKQDSGTPPEAAMTLIGIAGDNLSTVVLSRLGLRWKNESTVITAGVHEYDAIYTKNNDAIHYNSSEITIRVYGKQKVNIVTQVNGTGGTISGTVNNIVEGEETTIVFTPDAGYEIDVVTLDGVETPVTDNKLKVTAKSVDSTVVVKYKKIIYRVKIKVSHAQTDKKTTEEVEYGETLAIAITPDDGYRLLSVLVNNEESVKKLQNGVLTLSNILSNQEIEIIATRLIYSVVEGENQTYTIGVNDSATFKVNADYTLFENDGKIYVDNALVDKNNYISKSGSTIITFNKAYMDGLSNGEHTLNIVFNDGGEAQTTFKVTTTDKASGSRSNSSSNNPVTADSINYI